MFPYSTPMGMGDSSSAQSLAQNTTTSGVPAYKKSPWQIAFISHQNPKRNLADILRRPHAKDFNLKSTARKSRSSTLC